MQKHRNKPTMNPKCTEKIMQRKPGANIYSSTNQYK